MKHSWLEINSCKKWTSPPCGDQFHPFPQTEALLSPTTPPSQGSPVPNISRSVNPALEHKHEPYALKYFFDFLSWKLKNLGYLMLIWISNCSHWSYESTVIQKHIKHLDCNFESRKALKFQFTPPHSDDGVAHQWKAPFDTFTPNARFFYQLKT